MDIASRNMGQIRQLIASPPAEKPKLSHRQLKVEKKAMATPA
jgi:hypothetical protein